MWPLTQLIFQTLKKTCGLENMHLKDFHVHFVNQIHHMQYDGYLLDFIPVIISGHVVLDGLVVVE